MSDLPKIAQARLRSQQASAKGGIHPDANLLSAFVEGSLASSERTDLLAHLSDCADCREVVALSLPEFDAAFVQKSDAAPATSWLTNLGMMRWTAVAAGIIIVGAAVMLMNPQQSSKLVISTDNYERATESKPSTFISPPPPPATQAAKQGIDAANSPTENPRNDSAARSKALAAKNPSREVTAPNVNSYNGQSAGGVLGGVIQNAPLQSRNVFPPPPSAVSPESSNRKSSPNAFADADRSVQHANSDSAAIDSKRVAPQAPSDAASAPRPAISYGEARGASGGISGAATTSSSATPAKKTDTEKSAPAPAPPPPSAQVSANDIARKRSVGPATNNNTTEVVASNDANLAAKAKDENLTARSYSQTVEVSSAAPVIELSAVTAKTGWNVSGGKLFSNSDGSSRWKRIKLPGNPRLIALSVQPSDIWVGGAKGVLYHSPDSGKTWLTVVGGWSTESDITYLAFRDPQHGELRTSAQDRWTTSDAGKSWQKQ